MNVIFAHSTRSGQGPKTAIAKEASLRALFGVGRSLSLAVIILLFTEAKTTRVGDYMGFPENNIILWSELASDFAGK